MPFYRDLDPSNPTNAGFIEQGDDELRNLKQANFDQWPQFTAGPANPSLGELNALVGVSQSQTIQEQLDYLNLRVSLDTLPVSARNFQNFAFWGASGADDQQRLYVDYAQFQDYSNVPWPWGTGIPLGQETDYMTLFVERYVNDGRNIAMHRVTRINLGPSGDGSDNYVQVFFRGARNSGNILSAPWQRATSASISTVEATSGQVLSTTARAELEAIGCTPCP